VDVERRDCSRSVRFKLYRNGIDASSFSGLLTRLRALVS
jgi:hypothetical protein